MQIGKASGIQIAFFTFAALLLIVPVTRWLVRAADWSAEHVQFFQQTLGVLAMGAVLLVVPPLRRWCRAQLVISVPAWRRREALLVAMAAPLIAFATLGGLALFWWAQGGDQLLATWASRWASYEDHMSRSLGATGFAMFLGSAIVIPVVEELIFRGLLYKAWEERWGWVVAMVLSSAVFGLYHPLFWNAFLLGLINCVLYRRTASLLAPITVHGVYNAAIWYPFLGQFLLPADSLGDIARWSVNLACLTVAIVAIPAYMALGRSAAGHPQAASEPLSH